MPIRLIAYGRIRASLIHVFRVGARSLQHREKLACRENGGLWTVWAENVKFTSAPSGYTPLTVQNVQGHDGTRVILSLRSVLRVRCWPIYSPSDTAQVAVWAAARCAATMVGGSPCTAQAGIERIAEGGSRKREEEEEEEEKKSQGAARRLVAGANSGLNHLPGGSGVPLRLEWCVGRADSPNETSTGSGTPLRRLNCRLCYIF